MFFHLNNVISKNKYKTSKKLLLHSLERWFYDNIHVSCSQIKCWLSSTSVFSVHLSGYFLEYNISKTPQWIALYKKQHSLFSCFNCSVRMTVSIKIDHCQQNAPWQRILKFLAAFCFKSFWIQDSQRTLGSSLRICCR